MATTCAYCKSAKNKLTREHIWPSCIIKRVPEYNARYSGRADKVFSGDLVISDVCAECNNGPLAKLDAYIMQMYDRWFVQFPERGNWIDFDYDWSLLGRWLLKICFNSARANKIDADKLDRHSEVILGNDTRAPDLAIWLDLVEPTYYENTRDNGIVEAVRVPPKMTRVCRIQIPDVDVPNYTIRLVAINAFYFYLAIPNQPYTGVFDDLIHPVEFFSLMATLDPDENVVRAKTTGLNPHVLIKPHLDEKRELYDDYFNGQKH